MTFLWTFFIAASSSTNLYRKLLTPSLCYKLAGLFLNILGGARGLIDSPALLGSLAVTDFLNRFVALLHSLVVGLLLEGAGM